MAKAFDVMTHTLATCTPETSVAQVAALMRDRDIGNVLVMEDNRLRGIITDRDLALQALTGQDDAQQTPVRKYMTTRLVTGEPTWNLKRVAEIMAKHQIRRLPIVEAGQLVGIVSLGDVARHITRPDVIAKSLQAISAPDRHFSRRATEWRPRLDRLCRGRSGRGDGLADAESVRSDNPQTTGYE